MPPFASSPYLYRTGAPKFVNAALLLWRLVEKASRWNSEADRSRYERQQPEIPGRRRSVADNQWWWNEWSRTPTSFRVHRRVEIISDRRVRADTVMCLFRIDKPNDMVVFPYIIYPSHICGRKRWHLKCVNRCWNTYRRCLFPRSKTVTHLNTNRTRWRTTSLIETCASPLTQLNDCDYASKKVRVAYKKLAVDINKKIISCLAINIHYCLTQLVANSYSQTRKPNRTRKLDQCQPHVYPPMSSSYKRYTKDLCRFASANRWFVHCP